MNPVVLKFDLMRAPFCELTIWLSVNCGNVSLRFDQRKVGRTRILVTLLLLLPPTDPMLKPWPPEQYILDTVTLFPLVMATQSSWLYTILLVMVTLLLVLRSNPSELWAAGRPPLLVFGASPAELSRSKFSNNRLEQLEILKRCVGQFWMWRFLTTDPAVNLLTTMKWSGLEVLATSVCWVDSGLT
jgi:hypothetical protein